MRYRQFISPTRKRWTVVGIRDGKSTKYLFGCGENFDKAVENLYSVISSIVHI